MPRAPATLAELEARAATQDSAMATNTRARARRVCAALGQPIPAWCAVGRAPSPPAPRKYERHRGQDLARPVETTIPDALRVWAKRSPGAVIQVGQRGVALHVLGAPPLRFPDVSAAVAKVSAES